MNAWMCAPRTSDHDPANAIFTYNCNNCNVCNVYNFDSVLLFSIYYKSVMSVMMYSHLSLFPFSPHTMSLYVDMKMIRPWNC